MGSVTYHELVARFGTASQAFEGALRTTERDDALRRAREVLARAQSCGARLLLGADDDYPGALNDLDPPPAVLFTLGTLGTVRPPCVAIVGTRRATAYGERVTRELSASLARAGACVVSGLARGVDAAAHRGALDAGGLTAAVLGTGIDMAFPAAHRALHAQIGATGLLISEEMPGAHGTRASFPKRNRIIAALAELTIIVEAGVGSGALITAAHALDLERQVAAVPGPIDAPQSAGSNELLRDGAHVIASVADALALLRLTPPFARPTELAGPAERAIWTALSLGPCDADTLATRSALPARDCLAAITALELSGAIECSLTGELRRRG